MMNVINGGMHAGNNLAIQEHMIVPIAKRFSDAIQIASEVYHSLKKVLTDKYGKSATNIGDEGGFAPPMDNTREALESLEKAVEEAGYSKKVFFAIDSAASNFYNKEGYYGIDGRRLEEMELLDYYRELTEEYPIVALEDPFREEDFESFSEITDRLNIQIIGDDIFVTNVERLKRGIDMGAANALLLKINQIGTISESLDASELALRSGYGVIVSHRSGETEDTSIADIAVAIGCGQIKTGAPARGERTAKYNRLIRIEEELGKTAIMGAKFG
jgi:enolase